MALRIFDSLHPNPIIPTKGRRNFPLLVWLLNILCVRYRTLKSRFFLVKIITNTSKGQ
jgi:hypothetical protein